MQSEGSQISKRSVSSLLKDWSRATWNSIDTQYPSIRDAVYPAGTPQTADSDWRFAWREKTCRERGEQIWVGGEVDRDEIVKVSGGTMGSSKPGMALTRCLAVNPRSVLLHLAPTSPWMYVVFRRGWWLQWSPVRSSLLQARRN